MAQEFLLTNSLGGYSSAHTQFGNTRKYHGLLVAAFDGLERVMLVNRVLETLEYGGRTYQLGKNYFGPGELHPVNALQWELAELSRYRAIWKLKVPDSSLQITKQVHIATSANAVKLSYQFSAGVKANLTVRPLIGARSHHGVTHATEAELAEMQIGEHGEVIAVQQSERNQQLYIKRANWQFVESRYVYSNLNYPVEAQRGYEAHEDLLSPGELKAVIDVDNGTMRSVTFAASLSELDGEFSSVDSVNTDFYSKKGATATKLSKILLNQVDQFTVKVAGEPSVVAGYHWFGDWGRDTFISFNGVYLLTGKFADAKQLLVRWSKLFKKGLLPNRPFEGDYNSVDAVFWYAIAVWQYWQATGDANLVRLILPKLESIYWAFAGKQGTGLEVDERGLLHDTNTGSSATWMDAKINGIAITDRSGYAVEIQFLWYNYLEIVWNMKHELALPGGIDVFHAARGKVRQHFLANFWWAEKSCLQDCLKPDAEGKLIPTNELRPNQVIGLYLPFSIDLIGGDEAQQILKAVELELLTDLGLKTLSAEHPNYSAHYAGDQDSRDRVYHQGTVWPFLLGHYLVSYLKAFGDEAAAARAYARAALGRLSSQLEQQNLAYVPEIADPTTLRADGCISQSWSAATLLEAYALAYKN